MRVRRDVTVIRERCSSDTASELEPGDRHSPGPVTRGGIYLVFASDNIT